FFIAGLMVDRTTKYQGKKIQAAELKLVAIYILVMPAVVLILIAISTFVRSVSDVSLLNPGAHGFTELIYAFTSAGNNNGSAFAGITANTAWMNTALAVAMLVGRFFLIIPTLALAGVLVRKTILFFKDFGSSSTNENVFAGLVALFLWFTVLFANFAEAVAEGRGKAQADTLRKTRSETLARRRRPDGTIEDVPSTALDVG